MKNRSMGGLHYGMISPKLRTTQPVRPRNEDGVCFAGRKIEAEKFMPFLCSHFSAKILGLILALSVTAMACQVPVFRYALERWEPGAYRVRAPETLKVDPHANVEIEKTAAVTQLELYYPPKLRQASEKPIWSAPMNEANVRVMLDSPMRRELMKRLLAGQSAVWLLIESGDAAKDDAAAKVIEQGLQAAQEKLKLPDGVITQDEASDPKKRHENADVLQSALPLKIEFSTLRLSRSNAEEAALIAMLMHIEPDLGDYVKEPMLFPIFGRGRALEPMIGKGIHADNLFESSSYLCGACSCEIKEQNPGIDLLTTADWGAVGTDEVLPETVKIAPQPATTTNRPSYAIGASVILLALVAWLLRRKAE
jgi:hypothetical protein